MSHGGGAAALVAMGLGTEAQARDALVLVDGDFDAALQLLLSADEAQAGADEPPLEAPLADEKVEILVELGGCSLLQATKALARARGDVEAASERLLEDRDTERQREAQRDAGCLLSHGELVWALRGSFATAGLRAQLEALCNAGTQRLQPYMRSTVSTALLAFLRERRPGMERDPAWRDTAAWAARVLNAVADGGHLLSLSTVELLLECCLGTPDATDTDTDRQAQALRQKDTDTREKTRASVGSSLQQNASGSLNDVLCAILRRIDLESQGAAQLRQASCAPLLCGMLQLISAFVSENPRSPLPAACQTAMELARGLAQEASVVKNVWPTEQLVRGLSAVLRHRDNDHQAQVGGLDILHGLVGAYSQGAAIAAGASAELLALLTSGGEALLSALLEIVSAPPGSNVGDAGAGVCVVYTEACALVSELFSADSVISDMLCEVRYGESAAVLPVEPKAPAAQESCLVGFYCHTAAAAEPQLASVYYGGGNFVEPEPEPELLELRGSGILQAVLSALDADVGCSAVYDAAITVLSTIAQVHEHGHATAQRKLHEWVGPGQQGGRHDEAELPTADNAVSTGEMQELRMQELCVRDVFLRCSNSWSMATRLQTPRAALSFSAADAFGWDQPAAVDGDGPSGPPEPVLGRRWAMFTQEVLPALLQAHYRHARTCCFLSVMHSFLQGEALTAAIASNIAPKLATAVRELLSQRAPRMRVLALNLLEVVLSCRDSSAAAVAALAFARQGLDALINQDLENDENPYVQAAHKRCQERFASVVVLPHAETALALDKISKRIAHGEVEALHALRDQLSSQIGVTLYEAERANLFASVLQLVDRTGVGVLKRLNEHALLRLHTLLQESVGCLTLPIYQLPVTMRGSINSTADGLACLFQPLSVRFWRENATGEGGNEHISGLFEPIVSIAELEAFLLRRVTIRHPKFLAYCRDVVGCWIEDWAEDREGNKARRVGFVVGFDEDKCDHAVLFESNVSPPLVRSKFARRRHAVVAGRHAQHDVVTEAKEADQRAAQESANSIWKTFFGSDGKKSLVGVRVAARSSCGSRDELHRWRPATVVAGQSTATNSVSLVFDDDVEGQVHTVDVVDRNSNQSVFNLMHAAASAAPEQSDGCTWQWLDDTGWHDFSDEESHKLETSRQNGSHGCALMRGAQHIVQIDFKAMVQRSIAGDNRSGAVDEERPIRRAASSINLWSALERPRAGSDEARRRALSESDAVVDVETCTSGEATERPTAPVLTVTLHDLRGYVESSSPHPSNGRTGPAISGSGVLADLGIDEPRAHEDKEACRSRSLNSEMTLFQCIMHSAGGRDFSWDQTWSVDFRLTVDGEEDAQPLNSQADCAVPEAIPSSSRERESQSAGVELPIAYIVKGSSLQRINGRYDLCNHKLIHGHPAYLGTGDAHGKLLYWQPNHDGEWSISDAVGGGYRAVNRTSLRCTFSDNAPQKSWHVWKGTTKEWVDELSVTVEQVQSTGSTQPEQEPGSPELEPEPEPEPESEVCLENRSQLVVVVMENQRCDRDGDREFRATALLPSERGEWTDREGNPLPSPHSDPDPPDGYAWLPESAVSGWTTPTGWLYSISFATHEPHWTEERTTTALGSKPCVRRRRWERRVIQLPPEPSTPRTPCKSAAASAKQSLGSPAELVRMMFRNGTADFKRQWGLSDPRRQAGASSPGPTGLDNSRSVDSEIDFDRIAAQMGEQFVLQAFRDFQGTAFSASASASMPSVVKARGGDVPGLPSYTDALILPVVAPPPSYAAVMHTSALPSSEANFDDDLFAEVMGDNRPPPAQSRLSAAPEHARRTVQSQAPPAASPMPPQLALELDDTDEAGELFAEPTSVRSPCASLIYGKAGSYRQFDTRDISTSEREGGNDQCIQHTTTSQRHGFHTPSISCAALELLALLNAHGDGSFESTLGTPVLPFSWINRCLVFKLNQQLGDPLAVVASAFPGWIGELMSDYPFLFPIVVREEFFRVSAFGAARAVEWLRLQRQQHQNAGSNAPLGDRLGPLRVERWLIRRDDFLNQARRLLCHHAARRSLLHVEYEGESGIGTGVHVSFFTDAAARLSETSENKRVSMWMPDSSLPQGDALQCGLHPVSLLGMNAGEGSGAVAAVLRRFELLGWLFGKALIDRRHDERLLPLRLSPSFIDLSLGREPTVQTSMRQYGEWAALATLAAQEVQGGAMVLLLLEQLHGVRNGTIALHDAAEMIEMCEITFVDPAADEAPLCPGGEDRPVSWPDVEEFLGLLTSAWLGEGVRLQCNYFARALGQVVPLKKLDLFTTTELLELVCGAAVDWNAEDLEQCVVPGDGYTRDSEPYLWLLEVLGSLLEAPQRAAFLQFVTARPRLPSGGLHALPCPIRVQEPGSGGSASTQHDIDGRLPTAHTCSLTLDLPSYSSKAILEQRLAAALALMAEYEGLVD